MSEGGIILDFAVRGGGNEVRLSWDVRREGGVIFYFLRGGGADLFWNNPLNISSINSTHFREMLRPQFSFKPRGGILLRKVRL